jgi:hypothetical protein
MYESADMALRGRRIPSRKRPENRNFENFLK